MSKGFTYYTVDTNRYEDRRIKKLKRRYGCFGLSTYDKILSEIYRVKGCYLEWDDDTIFDISEYIGESEDRVREVVSFCAEIGLFSATTLPLGIITSRSIQERYIKMATALKRKNVNIREDIRLVDISESKPTEEMPKTPEIPPKTPEKDPRYSIVLNSIVENSIENNLSLVSEAERESFFEIFLFKNFIEPDAEVDNFINHYSATDKGDGAWYRKNSTTPIFNKTSLAKNWKESHDNATKQRRFYPAFLTVLYAQSQTFDVDNRKILIRSLEKTIFDGAEVHIYLRATIKPIWGAVEPLLDKVARVVFPDLKIIYRIAKK